MPVVFGRILAADGSPAPESLASLKKFRDTSGKYASSRILASQILRKFGGAAAQDDNFQWAKSALLNARENEAQAFAKYFNTFLDRRADSVNFLIKTMDDFWVAYPKRAAAFVVLENGSLLDMRQPLEDPVTMAVIDNYIALLHDFDSNLRGSAGGVLTGMINEPSEKSERDELHRRVEAALRKALSTEWNGPNRFWLEGDLKRLANDK